MFKENVTTNVKEKSYACPEYLSGACACSLWNGQ